VKEEQQAFYFACFLRSMGLNRHPGISGWYNASLLSVMPDPAENHGTRWLSRLYIGFQMREPKPGSGCGCVEYFHNMATSKTSLGDSNR
jgi:hypothetical protein